MHLYRLQRGEFAVSKPWWSIPLDLTPTPCPAKRTDVHAFDYAWHFENHDPGDEDRSER